MLAHAVAQHHTHDHLFLLGAAENTMGTPIPLSGGHAGLRKRPFEVSGDRLPFRMGTYLSFPARASQVSYPAFHFGLLLGSALYCNLTELRRDRVAYRNANRTDRSVPHIPGRH